MSRELRTTSNQVDQFLAQVEKAQQRAPARGTSGRLVFALDATASRYPTWESARQLQASMFHTAKGLRVQLVFYRGLSECRASGWCIDSAELERKMKAVSCLGGHTQIARVLKHLTAENREIPVNAAVFVGDAMEENPDELCHLAAKLGVAKLPLFVFQEGFDPQAENCFRQMAQLSGGAWCRFDRNSADLLAQLLGAIAVFANAGYQALEDHCRNRPALSALIKQLPKPS